MMISSYVGTRACFATVVTTVLLQSTAAVAADVAAVVVDFSGTVVKVSDGGSSDLKLGTNLFVGDEVNLTPGASLTIRTAGRCTMITETSEVPSSSEGCERVTASIYRIEEKGFAGALTERFAALSDVLAWWDPETSRKPMRSRDAYMPGIPALKDNMPAPLVEGERVLQIRWVDGAPPFTLSLEGPEGKVIAEPMAGDARRATIRATIRAGEKYDLVLKDGTRTNRHALVGVAAAEAEELPSTELDPLEQAASLLGAISESNGIWAFEVLQRMYTLPLDFRVKTALTDAIELGDWP